MTYTEALTRFITLLTGDRDAAARLVANRKPPRNIPERTASHDWHARGCCCARHINSR